MELIGRYITFLERVKGHTPSTLQTDRKIITRILRIASPITVDSTEKLVDKMLQQKRAPSYINQTIGMIRQWGECFNDKKLAAFPYPRINYKTDFVRATFEDSEIIQFLGAPNPYTSGKYAKQYDMWIMFYAILFYHGMRTIEIARLQTTMIDFGRNILALPGSITKTGESRLIPISPVIRESLKNYIFNLEGKYLFPTYRASDKDKGLKHVTGTAWRYFFNTQIKRLNIKRLNLTPYSGRHSYGSRQAEQDVSVFKIKQIMGHKRLDTTLKYIHLGVESLRKVQENDRLALESLTSCLQLEVISKKIREISDSYNKKVYTNIKLSKNGKRLAVIFEVRDNV
jgi:integrase